MRTLIWLSKVARSVGSAGSSGSALFSISLVELNNADLDIADQNGKVRGVRVIHLAEISFLSS